MACLEVLVHMIVIITVYSTCAKWCKTITTNGMIMLCLSQLLDSGLYLENNVKDWEGGAKYSCVSVRGTCIRLCAWQLETHIMHSDTGAF